MVKSILERDNPIARCAARVFSRAVSITEYITGGKILICKNIHIFIIIILYYYNCFA